MTASPGVLLQAPSIVASARRNMAVARAMQLSLLLAVGFCVAIGTLLGMDWVVWSAILLALVWIFLVVRSVQVVRQVREGWAALGAGHPGLAESRALEVLASRTLIRPATVGALVVLAGAWKNSRPAEAAQIATFVLSRRERLLVGDRVSLQMLLAETLLASGNVETARAVMLPLYLTHLSLADSLHLLLLQLRTEARLGAYGAMLERLGSKVDMADLMPPREGSLALALLWLAAARAGLADWASWLARRVKLLADLDELRGREPALENLGQRGVEG